MIFYKNISFNSNDGLELINLCSSDETSASFTEFSNISPVSNKELNSMTSFDSLLGVHSEDSISDHSFELIFKLDGSFNYRSCFEIIGFKISLFIEFIQESVSQKLLECMHRKYCD